MRKFSILFLLIACYSLLFSSVHAEDEVNPEEDSLEELVKEELKPKQDKKIDNSQENQTNGESSDSPSKDEFQVDESDGGSKAEDAIAEEIFKHEEPISPDAEITNIPSEEDQYTDFAWLQALNKITARRSSFKIPVGMNYKFGNLDIHVKKCWKSSSREKPENKALLRVWQQKAGEERKEIFFGWMFSSNPAVTSLENPVYDLSVIECVKK